MVWGGVSPLGALEELRDRVEEPDHLLIFGHTFRQQGCCRVERPQRKEAEVVVVGLSAQLSVRRTRVRFSCGRQPNMSLNVSGGGVAGRLESSRSTATGAHHHPVQPARARARRSRFSLDTSPGAVHAQVDRISNMSADPRATEAEDLDPDAACRLGLVHGLVGRADLNGRLARAVRWVPTKSRWALIMDGGEKVLVRDDNIDFQAPEAIEAEALLPEVATGLPITVSPVLGTVMREKLAANLMAAMDPLPLDLAKPAAPPIALLLQDMAQCFCLPFAALKNSQAKAA